MRYTEHRERNIRELCTVERAATGKKYKAGSCYVKLSAVDDFVGQIEAPGEIDSRFAVFEPLDGVDTEYLFLTVQRSFPDFLRRGIENVRKFFNFIGFEFSGFLDCVR